MEISICGVAPGYLKLSADLCSFSRSIVGQYDQEQGLVQFLIMQGLRLSSCASLRYLTGLFNRKTKFKWIRYVIYYFFFTTRGCSRVIKFTHL